MSFLHLQLALAGFACVAIPILIHLLMRRRRKPVMWGAMRFLLEAYRKQRRRLMLEKWLLLLTRCLLVAAIAAAVGRPLLGELLAGSSGRTLYILIDNSLTSQALGDDAQPALDRHKAAARDLLDAMTAGSSAAGDRVAIITLAASPDPLVAPPSADLSSARGVLDALTPCESRADIPAAFSLLAGSIERDRNDPAAKRSRSSVYVAVLSDFLTGSADTTAALAKLPADVRLVATLPADQRANVSIVGVEPQRSVVVTGSSAAASDLSADAAPQSTDQVRVLLRRSGGSVAITETTSFAVSLLADDSGATPPPVSRGQVRWAAGQETATGVAQIRSTPGSRRASAGVSIISAVIERSTSAASRSDSIAADNIWRRPLPLRESLRVGIIAPRRFGDAGAADRLDPADWARLALRPGDAAGVDLIDIEPVSIDGARLAGLDAVLIARPDLIPDSGWQRLRLFLDSGGLVFLFPAPLPGAQLWTDVMSRELATDLKLAREPRTFAAPEKGDAPMTLSLTLPPASAPRTETAESGQAADRDLLSLIRAELGDLARPVSVWQTLPIDSAASLSGSPILSLADGSPFVWASAAAVAPTSSTTAPPASRGLLVYFAAPLDLRWTDLPAKPLIVPLIQELLREGVGQSHSGWAHIAGTTPTLPSRSAELRIDPRSLPPDTPVADAEHQGLVPVNELGATAAPLRRAALWRATDERGAVLALLTVNPDPRGGLTDAADTPAVERWFAAAAPDSAFQWIATESPGQGTDAAAPSAASPASMFARTGQGRDFSLAMLVLALTLAVFELILARRSSHASLVDPASSTQVVSAAFRSAGGAA